MRYRASITVPVDARDNHSRTIKYRHMEVQGRLGPMDYPERLRLALADDEQGAAWLMIEFLYPVPPEEETTTMPGRDGAVLIMGKHSGRVIRLQLPVADHRHIESLMRTLADLETAARQMPENMRPPRRIAHYEMVSQLLPSVIAEKLAELRASR